MSEFLPSELKRGRISREYADEVVCPGNLVRDAYGDVCVVLTGGFLFPLYTYEGMAVCDESHIDELLKSVGPGPYSKLDLIFRSAD